MSQPVGRTCDLCGATRFRRLAFFYELEGQRLQGVQCRSCSLMFLDPLPTPAQLERLYGKEYFTERPATTARSATANSLRRATSSTSQSLGADKFTDYMLAHYAGRNSGTWK